MNANFVAISLREMTACAASRAGSDDRLRLLLASLLSAFISRSEMATFLEIHA